MLVGESEAGTGTALSEVNEMRDANRGCNQWTSATIAVCCSKNQTWKREMERDSMLCKCAQMHKFMPSDSLGDCCRLSTSILLTVTSLGNDLYLSYLRSSGIAQTGSRP